MSKKLAWVLAWSIAVLPLAANALGLGEIKLESGLNQPFRAEIPIVGAAADEIGSLQVKLADAHAYQQAGIPIAQVLSELQFAVVQSADGTARVRITSVQPVSDPFVDFLVDAKWDNGELIREYTVFLNPPNFETPTQAAPTPAAQPRRPASAQVTTEPPSAPPAIISATPPAPAFASPAVVSTASVQHSFVGSDYGPIRRGATLSMIALRVRPSGVTLNQMMIAIYRANPEVFMHNINLMKAGYVLRIPSLADVQAVQVAEANAEVRVQIEQWRARRGLGAPRSTGTVVPPPALQLVAPSSNVQTAKNQVPGTGEHNRPLVNPAGRAAKSSAGTGASTAATAKGPVAVRSNSLAAVESQAIKQNRAAPASPAKPGTSGRVKPLRRTESAPVAPAPSESLLGSLLNPYVILIAVILVLLIIVGAVMKNRRSSVFGGRAPVRSRSTSVETTDWSKEEKAGLKDVTATPTADQRATFGDRGHGVTGTAGAESLGMTPSLKLDEVDPMTEADFHMAYGLYDQAADVLKKALVQDPGARPLKMKLLEVYFTAGDRAHFVETARALRQEMGASPDKDWENIAIMGRQVAADEPLFSGGLATAGTGVDIPLDSSGTGTAHTDMDPLAGAFEGMRPVTVPSPPPAPSEHPLDFSLPDIEPTPARIPTVATTAGSGLENDDLNFEPAPVVRKKSGAVGVSTVTAEFGTDSQVEFDKALKELSDFVNTNVPPQEEARRSAAQVGVTLSLAADSDVGHAGPGEETTGLNEIGTKLDLARAYIDMGDAEGAKNILEEVLAEGDTQQKQEAQKLMQQLA